MSRWSNKPSLLSNQYIRRMLAAGVFALLLPWVALANTPASQAAFAAGKKAHRAGEFNTAAAHFEQALDAGHARGPAAYNLGVAHYRAGHYDAAENAFLMASSDPAFSATSLYNLGLVAKRRGDARDARIWFNQVRAHPSASKKLRRLAAKAITQLPEQQTAAVERWLQPREPKLSDFMRVSVDTGYGSDNNVYRSPSSAYVDLSDPTAPTIDPEVQSGSYVPVDIAAEIRWDTKHDGLFRVHYDFAGKFYSDQELSNADEMEHRFFIGGSIDRPTERGSWYWSGRFVMERYEQDAYDRDTGDDLVSGTEDVTDRSSYIKSGPRFFFEREWGAFGVGFKASGYIRDYDETVDYLDLSHEHYNAGVHFSYRPWQRTQLRLSAEASQRTYINRVAKDLTGTRFLDNDPLEYDYISGGLTLRQGFSRNLSVALDYRYTERTDRFEGYEDYTRHLGRVSLRYFSKRLRARAGYSMRNYDFANAFAYDNPTAELRTLDTSYAELQAEYYFTDHFGVSVNLEKDLVESNDARSEYDRMLTSISATWRL